MSSKKSPNCSQEKCMKCNKLPNEKKPTATRNSCKSLLCGECHGLTPTEVRVLELKTGHAMTFLCRDCKSAMAQLPNIMKKLNELTEEVKELRLRQSMLATESAINEITERANRVNNLIIYDISESTSDDTSERKEHDLEQSVKVIKSVTEKVNCSGIRVFRLRSPKSDASRPRPLKVVMRSKSDAVEVLRNKHKLVKPKSVTADLTPMQREFLKYLREELEKRTAEGEMDLTIKYVRGPPEIVNKPSKN